MQPDNQYGKPAPLFLYPAATFKLLTTNLVKHHKPRRSKTDTTHRRALQISPPPSRAKPAAMKYVAPIAGWALLNLPTSLV